VAINWQIFGSNGQVKADYSRGVLERFTRRAPKNFSATITLGLVGGNVHVKTIANPRKIKLFAFPHFPNYFDECFSVNENGKIVAGYNNSPVTVEKIAINHYFDKSREEFFFKQNRGRADAPEKQRDELFDTYDRNEEFDDEILKYRATRAENFSLEDDAQRLERVTDSLIKNLSAGGNLEMALTCRAMSSYLREKFPANADDWKICEEASLAALLKSLNNLTLPDAQLLIRELPKLLALPYPAVKNLRDAAEEIFSHLLDVVRTKGDWLKYSELDVLRDCLNFRSDSFD